MTTQFGGGAGRPGIASWQVYSLKFGAIVMLFGSSVNKSLTTFREAIS